MKTSIGIILAIGALLFAAPAPAADRLSEGEAKELGAFGAKAFGIQWSGPLVGGSDRGVVAVSDGVTTLTTRKGSRTYIVHDRKLRQAFDAQPFAGSDEELKQIGMRLLEAVGGNPREMAEVRVLQQSTQAAVRDPKSGGMKFEEASRGLRSLLITREIDGIPVLSSRVMLDVDRAGRIAFMELSWPDVSPQVLEAAKRLREVAAGHFEPPRMEGASVEAIQASILHSPAVGFFDDSIAAIRVIYRPDSKSVGQKPVRYVDESGKDVSLPRDVDAPREKPLKRSPRKG